MTFVKSATSTNRIKEETVTRYLFIALKCDGVRLLKVLFFFKKSKANFEVS